MIFPNGFKITSGEKCLDMPNRTIDYFLCHAGRTYSIPLISLNPGMGSYSKNIKRNDRPDLDLA